MVHALAEIHRTLIPDGILLDLRPIADRWPVEVVTNGKVHVMGCLTDLPAGLADDEAANNAIEESARRGLFVRQEERTFPIFVYWDNPDEMHAHIAEKWTDFVKLEKETFQSTQKMWNTGGADRRVYIRMKMLLTCWRKRS